MPPAILRLFALLVAVQAAHSVEEWSFGLYDSFPPARFVAGLVSADRERGFVVVNVALVAFGAWCLVGPVRRGWPSAPAIVASWSVVETANGIGHPLWSVIQRSYTPGVGTAPVLLVLGVALLRRLPASRNPVDSSRRGAG
ncbi:MAG TPA: HXXEE domain-containing protein [Acidimicrobiia bacterium]|nr:HXXEE domain-containing protein [Acidimicrobiia bacterium]